MKHNYGLKKEIEQKLFHGVVMPTANSQGFTLADTNKVVGMMYALVKKYHAMNKTDRKALISIAEKKIQETLDAIKGE
jgi:hypothetical protein